jgi:preprotein translocase subunit SecG
VLPLLSFADSFGLPVFVFFYFVVCIVLIVLVLMHSGRDTGMAGMGYVPASQGGTHIVERNLTRLTIVVATLFFIGTIVLYQVLQ